LLAEGEVELVPLFLGVAIGVGFEGGFVGEFHGDDVGFLHFGFGDVLDFEGFRPNAGDAFVLVGQLLRAVEDGLDLRGGGVGFEGDGNEVDDGLRGFGQGAGGEQSEGEGQGQEGFHSIVEGNGGFWIVLIRAL